MKIYLEVLIPIILLFISLVWYLWNAWSRKRLLKKYKPENDKARKGGEQCRAVERTEPNTSTAVEDIIRPNQPEGRELLQTTDVSNTRKDSSSIRNLLRKRRRN